MSIANETGRLLYLMLLVDLDEMELEKYSDALSGLGFDYNVPFSVAVL